LGDEGNFVAIDGYPLMSLVSMHTLLMSRLRRHDAEISEAVVTDITALALRC
jgi:hypothetical protein